MLGSPFQGFWPAYQPNPHLFVPWGALGATRNGPDRLVGIGNTSNPTVSRGPLAESKVNFNPGIFAQPGNEATNEDASNTSPALFTIVFIHQLWCQKNIS